MKNLFRPLIVSASLILGATDVRAVGPEGLEFQANTYTNSFQEDSATAGLTNGGFVTVWESSGQDGSQLGVYGQQYKANGEKLGAEFRVNDIIDKWQQHPEVLGLNDGGYVVAWSSSGRVKNGLTVKPGIYAKRYQADGMAVGGEFGLNIDPSPVGGIGGGEFPDLALLPDGGFVATWTAYSYQDSSMSAIMGRKLLSDGQPNGPEFIVNTYKTHEQQKSRIAVLSNGGFMIVWESANQDGSAMGVYGQLYGVDGIKVGDEVHISTETTNNQTRPKIVSTSDGGFIVMHYSINPTPVIKVRRFDSVGLPSAPEFEVGTGLNGHPDITNLIDGSSVLVWQGLVGDDVRFQTYAQILDGNLNAIGGQVRVNTATSDGAYWPDVESMEDGGFIVTWTSVLEQDGSHNGVFGQRYNKFGEAVELVVPQLNVGFTKNLSLIYDENGDGAADKAIIFTPLVYDYRLSLDELDGTQVNDELRVTDLMLGWTLVSAAASVGTATSSVVEGKTQLIWELQGADITTIGNAYVDIQLKESCGVKRIGREAFLQRKPIDLDHYITMDIERPEVCLVRLFDANGDGVIKYDGTGDEDGNGISDYIEACEMELDPCLD
jgi:hypothetical protein